MTTPLGRGNGLAVETVSAARAMGGDLLTAGGYRWDVIYPRVDGDWAATGSTSSTTMFGIVKPETGAATSVHPDEDTRLPALSAALGAGQLVSYRPGRRATVRLCSADGYRKVVRPKRLALVLEGWRRAASATGVLIPAVRHCDPIGTFDITSLEGRSLNDRLRGDSDPRPAIAAAMHALARLHSNRPPLRGRASMPVSSRSWARILDRAGVTGLGTASERFSTLHLVPRCLIHGDLHDKNIVIGRDAGFIDLDTVRAGAPEEDVGNLTAHLVLRGMQRSLPDRIWRGWVASALLAYPSPLSHVLVRGVHAHTLYRLSVLYRFRRSGVHLTDALLAEALSRRM